MLAYMGTAAGAATVAAGTAAVGAGVSAYGALQQGRSQERQANYQAKVEENNAVTAGYAAIQTQQAAAREVDQLRETRIRNLASQRVAAADSGLMISGSVLDTMGDSAMSVEKEIQMAYYRGQIGSYNQGQTAANLYTQASLTRSAGAAARKSGNTAAAGSFLSGISSAAGGYANFKKV